MPIPKTERVCCPIWATLILPLLAPGLNQTAPVVIARSNTRTLDNYQVAFGQKGFMTNLVNSAVVSLLSTGLALLVGVPAAYSLARHSRMAERTVWSADQAEGGTPTYTVSPVAAESRAAPARCGSRPHG
jgi:ABC-type spermidine/putrescine transport system permease subunit I